MTIDNSCNYLQDEQFFGNQDLTCLNIQTDVLMIGKKCFAKCLFLEDIMFANDKQQMIVIDDSAFIECHSLSRLDIPKNVNLYLKNSVFNRCSRLSNINIRSPNMKLLFETFMDCTALTCAEFADLKYLGEYTFMNCNKLTAVTNYGLHMQYCSPYAFIGCSNVKKVGLTCN